MQENKRSSQAGKSPGELEEKVDLAKLQFSDFMALHFVNKPFFYVREILKIIIAVCKTSMSRFSKLLKNPLTFRCWQHVCMCVCRQDSACVHV